MYSNKLVASLKVNGKILREFKDTVRVPFGSEYSILLKNLSTKRAIVNVFVDGVNVSGNGLVLSPSQTLDFQRSIANGNLNEGNAFKFIERTSAIENGPRGVNLEDGIIRVEFQFERVVQPQTDWFSNRILRSGPTWSGIDPGQVGSPTWIKSPDYYIPPWNLTYSTCDSTVSAQATSSQNDVGITVPGNKVNQTFTTVSAFPLEVEKHSIVLRLVGELESGPVETPVTVQRKPKCVTCGKVNRATSKFCAECGTSLELY